MSVSLFQNNSPIELTFGHFPESHPFRKADETRKLATTHNILNTLDWIPVIGIISGIARCILTGFIAAKYKKELSMNVPESKLVKNWLVTEAIRGVVSTLGLGFLFMVPDILFNMHRNTDPKAAT